MNSEYDYQPTDLNDELFLSEVPLELLINAIETQFQEPLEYRKKDYIQSFITKYDFSKENMLEDDQYMVDEYHDRFIAYLDTVFEKYLSIGFPELEDLSDSDQHELLHLTYRFFIKNIKKNFVNLVENYIEDHKKEIQQNYEKKKDVTALTFKTEIDDDYDILILTNLGKIIDDILDELIVSDDVDEFIGLCTGDEPILELEYVKHAYDNMQLTGNFTEKYIDMIDETFRTEIQSKIRNRILKKYPKRVLKTDVSLDDEEITETQELETTLDATEE